MLDVVPPLLLRALIWRLDVMTSVMVLLMVCPNVLTVDYCSFLDDEQLISTFYCEPILGLSNLLMLERSRFRGCCC